MAPGALRIYTDLSAYISLPSFSFHFYHNWKQNFYHAVAQQVFSQSSYFFRSRHLSVPFYFMNMKLAVKEKMISIWYTYCIYLNILKIINTCSWLAKIITLYIINMEKQTVHKHQQCSFAIILHEQRTHTVIWLESWFNMTMSLYWHKQSFNNIKFTELNFVMTKPIYKTWPN